MSVQASRVKGLAIFSLAEGEFVGTFSFPEGEFPDASLHLVTLTLEFATDAPAEVAVHPAWRWLLAGDVSAVS